MILHLWILGWIAQGQNWFLWHATNLTNNSSNILRFNGQIIRFCLLMTMFASVLSGWSWSSFSLVRWAGDGLSAKYDRLIQVRAHFLLYYYYPTANWITHLAQTLVSQKKRALCRFLFFLPVINNKINIKCHLLLQWNNTRLWVMKFGNQK